MYTNDLHGTSGRACSVATFVERWRRPKRFPDSPVNTG